MYRLKPLDNSTRGEENKLVLKFSLKRHIQNNEISYYKNMYLKPLPPSVCLIRGNGLGMMPQDIVKP